MRRFEEVLVLGVTRDADDDSQAAYQSTRAQLAKVGLPLPGNPAAKGATLRVEVMILPPEQQKGCLENVLWETVATTSTAGCTRDYVACAEIPEGNRRAKAMVHAYLATKPTPGLKIGEAAKAGYWELNHNALDPLKRFLSKLEA